ncbi:protein-histidine N-methyltransferase Ecym_3297 [Eremothecium cymbalariae DBVPG|uniref:protein-histidine N-methyltransferase n=1 Tax=Eremothecium cymbalariae (strain CBS 270.75 / DBVPG 7215 / KCTC 17166 / NRRL Y-17582) TaxID=931890 RepID=G8JRM0_ERECY|nr:Hypothetical protein Ecym_3297 [Eremothecium cymbalariae DBVPG\
MTFSFGFSTAELNGTQSVDCQAGQNDDIKIFMGSQDIPQANALDAESLKSPAIPQPDIITLEDLTDSLREVRLSFKEITTAERNVTLYRRELFDVKHQLMTEVGESTNGSNSDNARSSKVESQILMGETNEDLKKGVYEGGLKCWECSIDLVDYLSENRGAYKTVIELGCGTALPSQYLFTEFLRTGSDSGIRFILCDYNDSVLRLVTVTNLIIAWAKTSLSPERWLSLQKAGCDSIPVVNDELLLTSALLDAFLKDMADRKVELHFISGTWGAKFLSLLKDKMWVPCSDGIILTSETIYQPDTLPVISELLLGLIALCKEQHFDIKTYVAAKDIYFGVGGSVMEFVRYINRRIYDGKLSLKVKASKINTALKRSIISIE